MDQIDGNIRTDLQNPAMSGLTFYTVLVLGISFYWHCYYKFAALSELARMDRTNTEERMGHHWQWRRATKPLTHYWEQSVAHAL